MYIFASNLLNCIDYENVFLLESALLDKTIGSFNQVRQLFKFFFLQVTEIP